MPLIHLVDGTTKKVSYGSAAQLNTYLNEPEKLNEIKDAKEREAKEEFLSQVQSIDWSDLKRGSSPSHKSVNHEAVQKVLKDKTLKGKAKFDAVRQAMGA